MTSDISETIVVRVSKECKDSLTGLAVSEKRTLSNLIRIILDAYVNNHELYYILTDTDQP